MHDEKLKKAEEAHQAMIKEIEKREAENMLKNEQDKQNLENRLTQLESIMTSFLNDKSD